MGREKIRILIVGAGYAGVLTAKKLEKRLRKSEDVEISILDKNPFHTMLTELHEVAANRVDEHNIRLSLKKIFAGRKVNVIQDKITDIDFNGKTASGLNGSYGYDYLVVATGSRPAFYGVDGAEKNSRTLWSYDDAVVLREHILDCFRKASRETAPDEKRKLLAFFVVGAGFTGTEMMGELAEYVPILCGEFEIDRELVSLYLADMLSRAVPTLPEKLSKKIQKRLEKTGVRLFLNSDVVKVGEDFIELDCGGQRRRVDTDTVIWAAGIESSRLAGALAGKLPAGEHNRLKTDRYLRSLDDESVYVVGDNLYYVPDGEEHPVPQIVENCEQGSAVAAHNIACSVLGKGEMKEYRPKIHGYMVSAGGRYGVAYIGTAKRKIALPSFFAMFIKHFINVVYFVQVLGWNKVFSYIKHEFFTVRHNRSFVGGHFSNKTPSFLLVPLRLWLGAVWVFEGVMKIVDKWLATPKLEGFFGGAAEWFDAILKGAANLPGDGTSTSTPAVTGAAYVATDVISSATGAATETAEKVGQVLINFDFLGIFRLIAVSGRELADSALSDLALKLDVPLLNWFIEKLVLPYNGVQLTMQGFIILAEILIGLSLISGLFTTPSSAFSLVLLFMFACTTGLYFSSFWMVFAAIALLIGAGRIFGLDYYVMPFLKKKWKNLRFVRKLYIYND